MTAPTQHPAITVAYPLLPGRGWDPITVLARRMAELLHANYLELRTNDVINRARTVLSALPRRRRKGHCLLIAPRPAYLLATLRADHWTRGYEHVSAWVIDSFWTEAIPLKLFSQRAHVDHIFVADGDLVDVWANATGVPTSWLPLASDVLANGSDASTRPVDVLRIGRQPPAWDNDAAISGLCRAHELQYGERPPFADNPTDSHRLVTNAASRAKFVLAFSNKVSPASYTHPDREYLTARWIDALASGATVAGVLPHCQASYELLWPEASIELDPHDPQTGISTLRTAARAWEPTTSALNHVRALERLDLRWRIQEFATRVALPIPLGPVLKPLHAAISACYDRHPQLIHRA